MLELPARPTHRSGPPPLLPCTVCHSGAARGWGGVTGAAADDRDTAARRHAPAAPGCGAPLAADMVRRRARWRRTFQPGTIGGNRRTPLRKPDVRGEGEGVGRRCLGVGPAATRTIEKHRVRSCGLFLLCGRARWAPPGPAICALHHQPPPAPLRMRHSQLVAPHPRVLRPSQRRGRLTPQQGCRLAGAWPGATPPRKAPTC